MRRAGIVATAVIAIVAIGVALSLLNRYHSGRGGATGSVTGTFRVVGGPYPGVNEPVTGIVEARALGLGETLANLAALKGPVVASGTTTSAGTFSLDVAPGRYVLQGRSRSVIANGGPYPCFSDPVTVRARKTVSADIVCSVP